MDKLLSCRSRCMVAAALAVAATAVYVVFLILPTMVVSEAKELRASVLFQPDVPIVFTSRTETASFEASAPEADGFHYPGTIPWAAHEGRLRLLTSGGRLYELTWDRRLPDGGTLIDVMSPTITTNGTHVLFSGRRAAPDPGHWRIYRIAISGHGLEQLTGGSDDPGCRFAPPMRYSADGSLMDEVDRKRVDYDDVDPADDGAGGFFFASSRLPDLGRDHTRRATQIWYWPKNGAPNPLSANRNNDRWPFLAPDNVVLFSAWSRNREAVTSGEDDIRPVALGGPFATRPTDVWFGARVYPDGTQFGYAIKMNEPVWRPRPLFNGRVAFMTSAAGGGLRLAQADWGYLRAAPSSLANGSEMPRQVGGTLVFGPERDDAGRPITSATPSPSPGGKVLFAAAPVGDSPAGYGLYLADETWEKGTVPKCIFNDPNLVDAEPVAVYRRQASIRSILPPMADGKPDRLSLFPNRVYDGPAGQLDNYLINAEMPDPFPGQQTVSEPGAAIPYPTGVKSVAFYAAHRDRFDAPQAPRVRGEWEKLLVAPLDERGTLKAWVPANPLMPTVLAGLGGDGKVFKWSGGTGPNGRKATFYALAGDHYSGTRANGYHFCVGCHTGHTFIKADIAERVR